MAKKRRATSRKKGGRKARAARPKIDRASLVSTTIDGWCDRLRESASRADAEDKPKGACMVPDPAGGGSLCVFTDRDTCKAIKGTFLGGPC